MPKKGGKTATSKKKQKGTTEAKVLSEGYLIKEARPIYVPLPGENLLKVLTTHKVDEREVYNITVSTKTLRELMPEEIRDLKMVFDIFDSNNDGYLCAPELRMSLRALGFKFNKTEIDEIINQVKRGAKIIDFSGFIHCIIEHQKDSSDTFDEITQGFKYFDLDQTEQITLINLKTLSKDLNVALTETEIRKMFEEADVNGDGVITQDEFVKIMSQTNLYKQ